MEGGRRGSSGRTSGYGAGFTGDAIEQFKQFGNSELGAWYTDPATSVFGDVQDTADEKGTQGLVDQARIQAQQGSNIAEQTFKDRTEGMALSARQKAGFKQSFGLNREVTKAAASYATRAAAKQRSRSATKAMGLGWEDALFGQQGAAYGALANAEGQRQIQAANDKAAKKQKKNGIIGTIIGIGAAIFSGEEYKDKTEDKPLLLDKLKNVRVDKWKYKGSKAEHIGPYAEEFNKAFGVGTHKDAIDVVSMLGVTLGAVKELNEKVERRGL
jgi:hypothetical protein